MPLKLSLKMRARIKANKKFKIKRTEIFKKCFSAFLENKNAEKKILEKKILKKKMVADFKKKMFAESRKLKDAPPTSSTARKMRDPLNINGGIIKLAQKKWTDNDVEVKNFLNWLPSIVNDTGFFISEESPRVAMFHLGMKAKGGVINLKKGLFSKNEKCLLYR